MDLMFNFPILVGEYPFFSSFLIEREGMIMPKAKKKKAIKIKPSDLYSPVIENQMCFDEICPENQNLFLNQIETESNQNEEDIFKFILEDRQNRQQKIEQLFEDLIYAQPAGT